MLASIIIPTYNRIEKVLGLISRLERGDCSNLEIIVVSDGFDKLLSDALRRRKFGGTFIEQEHAGPGIARNTGAYQASGNIVVFVDDDVETSIDSLKMLAQFCQCRDGAWLPWIRYALPSKAIGDVSRFPNRASFFQFSEQASNWEQEHTLEWFWGVTCVFCLHRETFLTLGGFDPSYPFANFEDLDLSLRLIESGVGLGFCRTVQVKHWNYHSVKQRCAWALREGYSKGLFVMNQPSKAEAVLITSRYGRPADLREIIASGEWRTDLPKIYAKLISQETRLLQGASFDYDDYLCFLRDADRLYLLLEAVGYFTWTQMNKYAPLLSITEALACEARLRNVSGSDLM